MKKYIYFSIAILVLLSVISYQRKCIRVIREEREFYRQNTHSLLTDIDSYRMRDSFYVVSINELILTVGEYKKYRQEDMKLIEGLKVDKKRLERITTTQTQTIYELQSSVRDSIVYVDNYIVDTLRCLDIANKWFDMRGCVNKKNEFSGTFENRDSLLYVEHVIPKRFWFIKWGVKERKQEIVSRNPHTRITGAAFVTIRK
jgi:hypothetical protein